MVEKFALRIGAIRFHLVEAVCIAGMDIVVGTIHRRIKINRQIRNAGLPVFNRGVGWIQFIAGGVIADRTHDAAVGAGSIGLHAPIEAASQTNHRVHVDIHTLTEYCCFLRLVISLIGDAGGLESIGIGFLHQPLGHWVGAFHPVITVGVCRHRGCAAIHDGVLALPHHDGEVGDARLAGIHLAIFVEIVEDMTFDGGPPAEQGNCTEIRCLAIANRDVLRLENIILRLIPQTENIIAIGNIGNVERDRRAPGCPRHKCIDRYKRFGRCY